MAGHEMSAPSLRLLCKERGLYQTPALNDRLYASSQGYSRLEPAALGAYTSLRALHLEGNALESLDGLPALAELRCLYAQQNALTSLGTLGGAAPSLHALNVSGNQLAGLGGLEGCTSLRSLQAADNALAVADAAVGALVACCPDLESLDLQINLLEDPQARGPCTMPGCP